MTGAAITEDFPATYAVARGAFLEAAEAAGASISSHVHPVAAPGGEELALDLARFGPADATRMVLVASGTHGVEGRCGSGIQRKLIAEGILRDLPPGLGVLLVHAVNPYGFAYDRRVDDSNVDVNRNFLDHDAAHPENPAYEELYDVLNPEELDLADDEWAGVLTQYASDHGPIALFQATVGGQYRHPEGMQFGGTLPTWSSIALKKVWAEHLKGIDLAVNIDLHTGLGPSGTGTIMQNAEDSDEATPFALDWWGSVLRSARPQDADPISCGLLGPGFDEHAPARRTVAIVVDFGTLDPIPVLGAMRADNWLAQRGDRQSETGREISAMMRSAFFIEDPAWCDKVVERGFEVVQRAIDGAAAS